MTRSRRSRRCAVQAIPLAALPNVGLASLAGGRVIYPHSTPEYFAEFAAQAVALGARIVGGCCGTTPAQIEAIREAFDAGRAPTVPFERGEHSLSALPITTTEETALARSAPDRRMGGLRRARPSQGRIARGSHRRDEDAPRLGQASVSSMSTTTRWRGPDERAHDLDRVCSARSGSRPSLTSLHATSR